MQSSGRTRPSSPRASEVVARQLNHFDDMSADVVDAQGPGRCDPMVAIEKRSTCRAMPTPRLAGVAHLAVWRLVRCPAGASSITDRSEVPVEH